MSEKREALKMRLIDAAQGLIEEHGVANLKARDVAKKASCALGSIYTAFPDLDALIMHVNSRTLNAMGRAIEDAAGGDATVQARLERFAIAYYHFAKEHRTMWGALFEHAIPDDRELPDWHIEEQATLIRFIVKPLAELFPDLTPDALSVRARTWFSAVHGVVAINARRRFVSVSPQTVEAELCTLVRTLIKGS